MTKKSTFGFAAMVGLVLVLGPNAHAFTFLNCRSGDQTVLMKMVFSGQVLVSTTMSIQGLKVEPDPTTVQPGQYPERDGNPMNVKFVGYLVTLAANNATATVSADGAPLMTLNCCDSNFPQCQ